MDFDVIVIGAGAAGLAAARSLASQSLRVVILESRDRAGGRAWSHPSGPRAVPAELGAEFIHGPAPETLRLLREAGSAAIDADGGESWRFAAGELRPDDDFSSAAGIFECVRSLPNDESVDAFLARLETNGGSRRTSQAARAFVEGFDAADPAVASARAIADEWASGVDLTAARPLGGYRPMFEHLHAVCAAAGVSVLFSTVVRRVAWRNGTVAVDATGVDGQSRSYHARAAIVTLPVGVLRHTGADHAVIFEPNLPASKREALASIEMGHVVKVMLRFRSSFWTRLRAGRYRDGAFFRPEGQAFGAYWTQLPVRSELVVAWAGGPKAISLLRAAPAERIARARDGFGALFGEPDRARDELERAVMHDWTSDPFARGAYSYVAVGGDGARAELGAAVEQTLFFAGEATSTDGQGGTVNGALETGERAAREASAALQPMPVSRPVTDA